MPEKTMAEQEALDAIVGFLNADDSPFASNGMGRLSRILNPKDKELIEVFNAKLQRYKEEIRVKEEVAKTAQPHFSSGGELRGEE